MGSRIHMRAVTAALKSIALPRPRLSSTRKALDDLETFRALKPSKQNKILQARLVELRNHESIAQRTDEWHAARRTRITASEVPSFLYRSERVVDGYYDDFQIPPDHRFYDENMHISPFNGPEIVLDRKVSEERRKSNRAQAWGIGFEPLASLIYEKLSKRKLESFGLLLHDAYPWLGASVDGVETKNGLVVEIKCPSRMVSEFPELEPPELHYWVQVQIQLEVLGLPEGSLFTCYFMKYNDEEDFLTDPIERIRGCMLVPVSDRKKARLPTIYPPAPLMILDPEASEAERIALIEWANKEIRDGSLPPAETSSTEESVEDEVEEAAESQLIPTYKTLYWGLHTHTTKPIRRNKTWFESILPDLVQTHDDLTGRIADWDMETSERESVAGAKPAKRKTAKKRIKKKAGIEDDAGDQAVGDTISDEGGSGETVGKAAQKASRKKKISKKSDLEETAGGENAADVGDTISDDGGSGETVKRPAKRGPRKKTISKTGDLEEIAAEHVISDGRLAETSEQRSQEPSKKRTISQRIGVTDTAREDIFSFLVPAAKSEESIQKPKKEKIDKSDQEETAAVEDIFPSMTNGAKPVELSKKAAKASG